MNRFAQLLYFSVFSLTLLEAQEVRLQGDSSLTIVSSLEVLRDQDSEIIRTLDKLLKGNSTDEDIFTGRELGTLRAYLEAPDTTLFVQTPPQKDEKEQNKTQIKFWVKDSRRMLEGHLIFLKEEENLKLIDLEWNPSI
jgi:hypothetical protein